MPERRVRVREIDFDELSDGARSRFAAAIAGRGEPRPLARDVARPSDAGDAAIALLGAAIAAVTALRGFGEVAQGAGARGLYTLGALLVATGALSILHRRAAAHALPFAPGRYVFPLAFVDARTRRLEIARFEGDVRVEARGTGNAAMLEVVIGARVERFAAPRRDVDEMIEAIRSAREASADDRAADADGDPFVEPAKTTTTAAEGPMVVPLPRWLGSGPRAVLAVAFAALVGTAVFEVRERASDDAAFARAEARHSTAALEAYAAGGGRHAAEVRDKLLPAARAAAESAKQQARAARAAEALAKFRARASADDPRLVPAVERLVAALQRRGDPKLALAFRPPTRAVLDAVDGILAERAGAGFPVAKVAPHFDAEHTKKHEAAAARAIAAAFAEALPADVVRVEPGEASDDAPSIDVGYIVGWAGDAVVDEAAKRRYVSVVVDFRLTIDVPGEATYQIRFRVPPPEDLEVKVDADAATASDAQVYDAMATHAFNSVGDHVRRALLKP